MTAAAQPTFNLTERQMRVLSLVVQEYIRTGQPVPSALLVRRHRLGVSSATVRAEMATLEDLGLLTHPHTSAGRVPTVAGYRYFVENLLTRWQLPARQRQAIRARFLEAGWDPERWMQIAADMIAQLSGAAGLAAALAAQKATLRRLEMVDLGDGIVQIVVVMADGHVRQVRWCPSHAYDQAALDAFSRRVNECCGQSQQQGWLKGVALTAFQKEAAEAVRQLTHAPAQRGPGVLRLYHAGLSHIVSEPELALSGQLRGMVSILERGEGLDVVVARLRMRGADVFIGGEPPLEQLPPVALILSRFGGRTRQDGVVGVVGPTRLPYDRAVSAVEYVAEVLTTLLTGRPVAAD